MRCGNLGYVNSVDEAYKLIAEFETGSTTKFSCFKADKGFGNTGMYVYIYIYIYIYINGAGQSLPWHKVLNAVVAELGIYK